MDHAFLNEDLLINIAHSSQGPSSVSKWERGSIEVLIMQGRLANFCPGASEQVNLVMDECVHQQGFHLIVFNRVAQYFNCFAHTSDLPDSVITFRYPGIVVAHKRVIFYI